MRTAHTIEFPTLSSFTNFSGGIGFVVGDDNVTGARTPLTGSRTDGVRGGTVTVQATGAELDFIVATIRKDRSVTTDMVRVNGDYLTARRRKGCR